MPATERLTHGLATLAHPPATFVMASGMGIYGDRGDELLSEASSLGVGFLAELARDWEAAATPARERGVRVVALRLGLVLSSRGGLLRRKIVPRVFEKIGFPEAVFLHMHHAERTFTFETPSEADIGRRVRAQLAMIGEAVRRAV